MNHHRPQKLHRSWLRAAAQYTMKYYHIFMNSYINIDVSQCEMLVFIALFILDNVPTIFISYWVL